MQADDAPLPNKSQRTESDLESSMPRAMINKYNTLVPHKGVIEAHKKIHEQQVQKNLMNNFSKTQKVVPKKQNSFEQVDPKRRAMREGLLKNI